MIKLLRFRGYQTISHYGTIPLKKLCTIRKAIVVVTQFGDTEEISGEMHESHEANIHSVFHSNTTELQKRLKKNYITIVNYCEASCRL